MVISVVALTFQSFGIIDDFSVHNSTVIIKIHVTVSRSEWDQTDLEWEECVV